MKTKLTKFMSAGLALMGLVHIAATFSPVISGKLEDLPIKSQHAFMYMSLMCGALLVLGGGVLFMLSGRLNEYPCSRRPFLFTLFMMIASGALAVVFMTTNPCAWIILGLSLGLLFNLMCQNVTK